ncbi:MAG: RNA methyltransferase [Nitrospirota bacterium]
MKAQGLLNSVSIVLVRTKTPGNIGAVARSMMNMGLSRLMLVRPPQDDQGEAVKFAAGAEAILRDAVRTETLQEAVAGHGLVIGTSRHLGRHRRNIVTPREMADRIVPLLSQNRIALVFGREVNGLDSEDLNLCNELIVIPSSDDFPSLNLSHAVCIVAYELFLATHAGTVSAGKTLAPTEALEVFYQHLQKSLEDSGFLGPHNKDHMMTSLRQLFGKSRLEQRDISILHGVLSAISRSDTSNNG